MVELTPVLLRVAGSYVPSPAVAEEAVQETWLGVIKGLERFEGRSSLRAWVFCILLNQARTRGRREQRTIPIAAFVQEEDADVLDLERWPAHWATPPRRRADSPEGAFEDAEVLSIVHATVDRMPALQRLTIVMRDLEGWPASEVCHVLDITQGNQRVLLHRARIKVRAALVEHLA